MTKWLDAHTWARVQQSVPIACVDMLALEGVSSGARLGLIFRDTPHEGRKWCLLGGRILLDEVIHDAVRRHVVETLGNRVECTITTEEPLYVAQYFTDGRTHLWDPRQHAIALTYAGIVHGEVVPSGEAYQFEWFPPSALPSRDEFGFGQDAVVERVVTAIGGAARFRRHAAIRGA